MLFKKKPIKQEVYPKWINCTIETSLNWNEGDDPKLKFEQLMDFAEDLWTIVMNTYSLFDNKGNPLGYINPYLQPNRQIA